MHDDLIVCLLGDSLTRAEHTLIGGGHHASVLDTRGVIQSTMRADLTEAVERLSGRACALPDRRSALPWLYAGDTGSHAHISTADRGICDDFHFERNRRTVVGRRSLFVDQPTLWLADARPPPRRVCLPSSIEGFTPQGLHVQGIEAQRRPAMSMSGSAAALEAPQARVGKRPS
jgi:hypothetical protein